jgi:glyoxylase-like metal-dependent hydrolase (beta-lactamase superfamily II)
MSSNKYKIDILHEGKMKVDGGVTFSGLPRSEWQKYIKPDKNNRILIGLNQLLIRSQKLAILIDTGLGNKLSKLKKKFMGLGEHTDIASNLKNLNLDFFDITHVIFTHLHFDHAGGATTMKSEADEVTTPFDNARFIIQKKEWEAACNPDDISRSSYSLSDYLPLSQTNRLNLINGDFEVAPGIFVEVTGGHTAAHQMVKIEDQNQTIIFCGDICPTRWHINPENREAFDLYPCETLQARKNLVAYAMKKNARLVFPHDPEPCFCKLEGNLDRPLVKVENET